MKKMMMVGLLMVLLSAAGLAEIMNNQVTVAHVGSKVRWSQVALGPDGIAHVCYIEMFNSDWPEPTDRNPVYYVSYDGTKASTPLMLTANFNDFARQPGIAAGVNGMVAVVWAEPHDNSIFMRVFDPAIQDWQPIERVSNWGQDEPSVVIEPNGNIHVFFWHSGYGSCIAKSKINGVWEDEVVLSNQDTRCMKGNIALGEDGTIWACWMERDCSNSNACMYKTMYSTRTASTGWLDQKHVNLDGLSQELPFIAVGPNGIPWVTWGDTDEAEQSGIVVAKLDRVSNPIDMITARGTQHGPRVAADIYNNCHIACQEGPGDLGNGILYLTNKSGNWQSQMMWGAFTKAGGVSADGFGNVAVCWSAYFGEGGSDVYINSLDPITPKYFFPPVNLTAAVSVSGVRHATRASYQLSWSANPSNTDSYLAGYKIYVKENSGSYQLLATVSKTTFSQTFDFTDSSKKRRFAVATVNLGGAQSVLAEF